MRDEVFVESFNGVMGDNFQVYYLEQAPSYIMPQTRQTAAADGVVIQGSPEAGLTNQENWTKHGVAIAGGVAPTNTTRAGIQGFVRSY